MDCRVIVRETGRSLCPSPSLLGRAEEMRIASPDVGVDEPLGVPVVVVEDAMFRASSAGSEPRLTTE